MEKSLLATAFSLDRATASDHALLPSGGDKVHVFADRRHQNNEKKEPSSF